MQELPAEGQQRAVFLSVDQLDAGVSLAFQLSH